MKSGNLGNNKICDDNSNWSFRSFYQMDVQNPILLVPRSIYHPCHEAVPISGFIDLRKKCGMSIVRSFFYQSLFSLIGPKIECYNYHFLSWTSSSMSSLALNATYDWICLRTVLHTRAQNILHGLKKQVGRIFKRGAKVKADATKLIRYVRTPT